MNLHFLLYTGLPLFLTLTSVQAQAIDPACSDPAGNTPINTQCYVSLGISKYITDWWAANSTRCAPNTPFAQCFLQTLDQGDADCVGITSGTCPLPSWIQYNQNKISIEDFYVAYNIYSVWTFFNGYWTAIGNARSIATDNIGAIVQLLDPPKTTNGGLNDLLTALSVGLSFVSIDAGPIFGALLNGIQQAPGIGKFLFPVGTTSTQTAQFDEIALQMGTVTSYLQDNVTAALAAIQHDPTTFLAFVGGGSFSINPVPSIAEQSDAMLSALNTYVISQCLQANNWVITRAVDTDINQLQANGSANGWNVPGCGTGYNGNSMCGAFWYDKTTDISYSLTNNGDMGQDPTNDMSQFFSNWTTPELLIGGAVQCQLQGGGSPTSTATATGITTSCLSNMKICTWDLNPKHLNANYEFTDCPLQTGFGVDGCKECNDGWMCYNVPFSYIGNFLTYNDWGMTYAFCFGDSNVITG